MLSKPTFEVDLIKAGGKTLSFTCSYTADEHPEGEEQEEGQWLLLLLPLPKNPPFSDMFSPVLSPAPLTPFFQRTSSPLTR